MLDNFQYIWQFLRYFTSSYDQIYYVGSLEQLLARLINNFDWIIKLNKRQLDL